MEHSLFSASASERWLACPGTIHLCKDLPDRSSAAAQEGSRLHAIAEHCLRNDENPKLGHLFNGSAITTEHVDWVQHYLDYVRGFSGTRLIERKINYATPLGLPHHLAFGTCDLVIVRGTHVHVIDAKFGRGPVKAMHNTQMMLYASGFVHTFEYIGRQVDTVDLHIVQPRVTQTPECHSMTRGQLDSAVRRIRQGASAAHQALLTAAQMDGAAWARQFLRRGEKQCRWCPARGICPAW